MTGSRCCLPVLRAFDGAHGARPDGDGHVVVADFVCLQCGDTCALVNRRVAELARSVADPAVRFVTFSVDADDGPPTLARYRRGWDRRHDPRWRFVAADAVRFFAFAVDVGLATDTADVPQAFADNREGSVSTPLTDVRYGTSCSRL